ncbi:MULTISPECIES: Asp-tRNA(Asn)/Glu-tRNA(Gln) amidotransferase subunit GatA [Desulfococcus]|jgi:aspartyl-tRNA(Asn)/glutamyl-tRNA(Gln) amidotransferase subunit A|uniref:Glutamyl-tRNA(Gln) amidotransferase subunit A n=1 Tax=Desulfococcus multivorans DSM 2059 TaxID=1121405 RepID=S7TYK5_DESML|nr:Asp-tRNA(Asn)/Glu-tRNA(Gln) amidotransferase subunit GatA [Desulfococcus multivorans]AOY57081.1 GatA: glutamyl-tRNA(Gln) amidotransferase, subunit alpha [Desulfococcus multivorans]AQU99591.1 aspartyl/glutamyl-tRNA amidotransferase subunit A [Desulfococcus multivorans]EPR41790.1 Glutamyl-tRNA(Gln) amidotransferase subunit A [Desulfococcus multivorans DSM 2059]MDX9818085.1 Asp-tRNA(Asn)/Glu-tRNA(Gln) amidotransferase subunit GatA [Desulfococcus multivorans]SJZ88008.1 aspartyl/glutamyl-tRNA(As
MKLYELTIHEAHDLLRRKEISAVELTGSVLDRIREIDPRVGAYITVAKETALSRAAAADRTVAEGRIGPLTGIPLAVKDLICTRGLRTTCASRILENFVPPYDAAVIEALNAENAVIIGKVNMDEFAMGSSTENSAMGITRNPWDLSRIPGGSSGGSAAAVAADMCLGALGSDTGGSIRQPASHCGVVGLKPTYGRVSRYGLVAFASSLDQIGPLTKDVTDCALVLSAIAGHDRRDSTSVPRPVPDYTAALRSDIAGIRIGLPREYHSAEGLSPEVSSAVRSAVEVLEGMGARCVEISLPHAEYAVAAYYLIAPSEASSNLARYDGVKYGFRDREPGDLLEMYRGTRSRGFGPEVQRRIILGTYALSAGYYDAYYGKASQVRTLIVTDFRKAFDVCDVILSPVAPTPAFPIGEKVDDPLTMYLSDIFTLSANLAGIPGMSVPCGFSAEGLPIGLQLMGNHFDEETLLKVGYAFEQATTVHLKKPVLP